MSDDVTDNTFDDLVLQEVNCCNCAVRFAVTKTLYQWRRKDGKTFWCPNGHGNCYGLPEKPRDEQLEDLQEQVEDLQNELVDTKDAAARAQARHAQQIKQLTEASKRTRWW